MLFTTKHTALKNGCSAGGLVATERHLWLKITDIREKEFLLDAPVSQLMLFDNAVNAVFDK